MQIRLSFFDVISFYFRSVLSLYNYFCYYCFYGTHFGDSHQIHQFQYNIIWNADKMFINADKI